MKSEPTGMKKPTTLEVDWSNCLQVRILINGYSDIFVEGDMHPDPEEYGTPENQFEYLKIVRQQSSAEGITHSIFLHNAIISIRGTRTQCNEVYEYPIGIEDIIKMVSR